MAADGSRGGVYRFDRFTLDTLRGALLAAGGTEVALRPKAFALLARLVQNAGRLMDRDEIMRAIWPGVTVTDDSITQCVKEIRRALGDEDQRLLRTLPRRGFLFAAEVARDDATATLVVLPEAASNPPQAVAPRPPSGRPVVVVLPFEEIGADPDQAYFAGGLTADLVTDLARFHSLHVVCPRRGGEWQPGRALPVTPWSVGEGAPPPRAAGYLVTGSVRRAGGRIRVTARLEDAESGVQLWADRFDRQIDDLFAVQEELAECLAARLVSQVDQEGMRRARGRPPASLDAYDLCLRGRELRRRGNEADTIRARELFELAIAADPYYAPSHAWLAYTLLRGYMHWWGEPRGRAALGPCLAAARRAVQLDPESPTCVSRLGLMLGMNERWDEALETSRAAVALGPGVFEARQAYAQVLTISGDPEESVRQYGIALSLDPFHPVGARTEHARALLLADRRKEALAELRECTAREPDYGPGFHYLATAAMELGLGDEAREALRHALHIAPHWTVRNIDYLYCFRRPADGERFRQALRAAGLPEG